MRCEKTHTMSAKHTQPDAPAAAALVPVMERETAAATLKDFEGYVKVVDMRESDALTCYTHFRVPRYLDIRRQLQLNSTVDCTLCACIKSFARF
jgi:hypothetical protein